MKLTPGPGRLLCHPTRKWIRRILQRLGPALQHDQYHRQFVVLQLQHEHSCIPVSLVKNCNSDRHLLGKQIQIQTLICVLVARPRRCLTLSNPVPLTKLNGGLSRLHSADEDAVSWLTSYGKWHAYEKKKTRKTTHHILINHQDIVITHRK